MTLRLGIDCDGILYEWDKTARFILKDRYGYDLPDSQGWDYIKENIKAHHWKWLWSKGITENGLFKHGSLYKGSAEALRKLTEYGRLVLITSRPKLARIDTLQWIAHHELPFDEVHILSDGENKSGILCDLYVDDSPDNCKDLLDNTVGVVLIWDRPWNQEFRSSRKHGFARVSSWVEVIEATRLTEEWNRTGEAVRVG